MVYNYYIYIYYSITYILYLTQTNFKLFVNSSCTFNLTQRHFLKISNVKIRRPFLYFKNVEFCIQIFVFVKFSFRSFRACHQLINTKIVYSGQSAA